MQVSIYSEINPLQSVLIHRPGIEHSYVSPENLVEWIPGDNELIHNPNYLLFDDLIQPNLAMEEHDQLSKVIQYFIGNDNCIEFTKLLLDILHDKGIKKALLKECIELENSIHKNQCSTSTLLKLQSMDEPDILHILLTGKKEYGDENMFFQHPIPNLIFTRDIAAVVGKTVLTTWGRRIARKRENILAKYIFNNHDIFQNVRTYDFHENFPNLSVEGGDIIILDANTICIGISERTPPDTINALLPLFFKEGFERIYAIDLPKKRSTMHLDTIFNRISLEEVIIFPPILNQVESSINQLNIHCIAPGQRLEEGIKTTQNFLEILADDGIQLKPINCGGKEEKNQIREQWTDGANYFAISPSIIIGYDRNNHTIQALKHAGYKCIESIDFLSKPEAYNNDSKLMISIPSGELSRGRGGARCLTLPLERSNN